MAASLSDAALICPTPGCGQRLWNHVSQRRGMCAACRARRPDDWPHRNQHTGAIDTSILSDVWSDAATACLRKATRHD